MKAGEKVPNPFSLELFVADDIHEFHRPGRNCEKCKAYLLVDHETLNEHLLFDHNVNQRAPLTPHDGELHNFVMCPDCGRAMECYSWSDTTIWRCRKCGFEWRLERREAFDPKELARREAKGRKRNRGCYVRKRGRR